MNNWRTGGFIHHGEFQGFGGVRSTRAAGHHRPQTPSFLSASLCSCAPAGFSTSPSCDSCLLWPILVSQRLKPCSSTIPLPRCQIVGTDFFRWTQAKVPWRYFPMVCVVWDFVKYDFACDENVLNFIWIFRMRLEVCLAISVSEPQGLLLRTSGDKLCQSHCFLTRMQRKLCHPAGSLTSQLLSSQEFPSGKSVTHPSILEIFNKQLCFFLKLNTGGTFVLCIQVNPTTRRTVTPWVSFYNKLQPHKWKSMPETLSLTSALCSLLKCVHVQQKIKLICTPLHIWHHD